MHDSVRPHDLTRGDKPRLALKDNTAGVREREDANRTREAGHLDEIQGVVANTLNTFRNGAACRVSSFTLVGFIDGLNAKRRIQDNTFLVPPERAKRSPEYVAVASCTQRAYKRGSWHHEPAQVHAAEPAQPNNSAQHEPENRPKRKAHPKLKPTSRRIWQTERRIRTG